MTANAITQPQTLREIETLRQRIAELEEDIENRKRSEAKFRLAVEMLPTAMMMMDREGQIVFVNGEMEKLFGYARPEMLGQQVELIVPSRLHERHLGNRNSYFAKSEARAMGTDRDLFGRRKDGSEFPVEIALNPIQTDDGCLILGAIVDVTERRRVEDTVRKFNEELERRVAERTAQLKVANDELEAFSYSVSHDLRAPLRAVDGFTRILLAEHAEAMSTEAREYLQDVRANTQQMGQLIDDLLAFSRLGLQSLKKQRVVTAGLVEQCLEDLRAHQLNRRVEIIVGELSECWADAALLKQVWMNLLSNAFKYTGRRELAIIEIASEIDETSGSQRYSIKDNGVGFDMRYANKLFGVFHRLHRAEEYEGTGVGLAIVQRIVHRHGGQVYAEAEVDKGAMFSFTLPEERTPK